MEQLADALRQLPATTWALVVHLGAGHGGALSALNGLEPERLVLVEGDPDALARLSHRNDLPAGVQIRAAVLGAQSSKALWHRYTLSTLNGPLDAAPWGQVYPRLRLLSSVPVDVQPVATVVAQALEGLASENAKLLILDLPGQEDELLASVPGDLLWRFDWIIVRGCATPPGPDWSPAATAVQRLTDMGYTPAQALLPVDPLWPLNILRFDATAFRMQQLQAQVQQLKLQSHRLEAERDAAREQQASTQADGQTTLNRVAELEAAISLAQTSSQTVAERLRAERDDLTQARDTLSSQLEQHKKLAQEDQHRAETLQQELAQLSSERAELVKAKDALSSERDALIKSRGELTTARDEQGKLAAERQQRVDALGKERDEIIADRDGKSQRAEESQRRAETLQKELAQLSSERAAERAEIVKAKDALSSERDALIKSRSELTTARDEQGKLAAERQQRIDALSKERADLIAGRDALTKERTALIAARDEQTKTAREAREKLGRLESELAELMARHGLLQEELIKAEAQIELIADVLLREPRG